MLIKTKQIFKKLTSGKTNKNRKPIFKKLTNQERLVKQKTHFQDIIPKELPECQ